MNPLKKITDQLLRELTSGPIISQTDMDYFRFRVENVLNLVMRCNQIYNLDVGLIHALQKAARISRRFDEEISSGYKAPLIQTDKRGRPSYDITRSQLLFYIENGFTVCSIAKMIGVSDSTVKRRLKEYGISINDSYTQIDDLELDESVKKITDRYPNCGYRRMYGLLFNNGIKVSERRIRESMHRVDPEGILVRALQLTITCRRQYKVPGILALWHIDGHHKLIRYGMVMHR